MGYIAWGDPSVRVTPLNLQLAAVRSDWEGTNAIAIGKWAYQLLTAWFSSSKDKVLAQRRMLSAREVPAGAISREPLSILLHTSIFKCLKTTYHEPKLGKPGFSPRVSFSVVIKQTTRRQNSVLSFQPWTVEGTRKATTPGSGWTPFKRGPGVRGHTGWVSLCYIALSSSCRLYAPLLYLTSIAHIEMHFEKNDSFQNNVYSLWANAILAESVTVKADGMWTMPAVSPQCNQW